MSGDSALTPWQTGTLPWHALTDTKLLNFSVPHSALHPWQRVFALLDMSPDIFGYRSTLYSSAVCSTWQRGFAPSRLRTQRVEKNVHWLVRKRLISRFSIGRGVVVVFRDIISGPMSVLFHAAQQATQGAQAPRRGPAQEGPRRPPREPKNWDIPVCPKTK